MEATARDNKALYGSEGEGEGGRGRIMGGEGEEEGGIGSGSDGQGEARRVGAVRVKAKVTQRHAKASKGEGGG